MNTPKIKCIIFDWDGTLIDSIAPLTSAFNSCCDQLGVERPNQIDLRKSFGNHSKQMLMQLVQPKLDHDVDLNKFIIEFESTFIKLYKQEPSRLILNAKDTLAKLQQQGYQLCIASNAPRIMLDLGLKQTQATTFFQYIVCADEFAAKPEPHMLEQCAIHCETLPEQCLMVGDHCNDLLAAKAAQMRSIAVLSGSQSEKEFNAIPHAAILKNINALPQWLDDNN